MRHVGRLLFIVFIVLRYGLDEVALSAFRQRWVRLLVSVMTVGRRLDAPRGQRLRMALERLGPIFVKFGQVLSTRRDLLPADIADDLARLQDRVPPMSIDGDAALAADFNWIAQNVRWDPAADAERFFGATLGEGVSRASAQFAQAAELARTALGQVLDKLQSRQKN